MLCKRNPQLLALILISFFSLLSWAQHSPKINTYFLGEDTLEFGVSSVLASQDDINGWIVANGGQQLGLATEYSFSYVYRFTGSLYSLVFRPSYFVQKNNGPITASLNGSTMMTMIRIYPLENNFINFFMQLGMGFGNLNGNIANSTGSTDFSGSAFGAQSGFGADFCFVEEHCLTIEGIFRYLPIVRSTTSNSTGTLGKGFTATGELASNNMDVQNTLTGIQAILAYSFKF